MIARENAEGRPPKWAMIHGEIQNSSGIIGDGIFVQLGGLLMAPGILIRQIRLKIMQHRTDAPGEIRILQANPQFVI